MVEEVIFLLGLNLLEIARDAISSNCSLTNLFSISVICSREILPNRTLDKVPVLQKFIFWPSDTLMSIVGFGDRFPFSLPETDRLGDLSQGTVESLSSQDHHDLLFFQIKVLS